MRNKKRGYGDQAALSNCFVVPPHSSTQFLLCSFSQEIDQVVY